MTHKNLADREFQEIIEQFKKGQIPKGAKPNSVKKHPVKNRQIVISAEQQKAIRR